MSTQRARPTDRGLRLLRVIRLLSLAALFLATAYVGGLLLGAVQLWWRYR